MRAAPTSPSTATTEWLLRDSCGGQTQVSASRIVFVCTANTARSHLATAAWRRVSDIPATSAGTHRAKAPPRRDRPAQRHDLDLPAITPARWAQRTSPTISSSPCATVPTRTSTAATGHTGPSPTPCLRGQRPAPFDDALGQSPPEWRACRLKLSAQPVDPCVGRVSRVFGSTVGTDGRPVRQTLMRAHVGSRLQHP